MKNIILAVSVATMVLTTAANAQELTVEKVAAEVAKTESAVLARMRGFQPIVEVYLQTMDEKLGTTPIRDEYLLGQFQWSETLGPQLNPLTPERLRGWAETSLDGEGRLTDFLR